MTTSESLPDRQTWTAEEAGAILGFHPDTLRRMARTGKLRGISSGGKTVFSRQMIAEWLETGEIPRPNAEPSPPVAIHKHRQFR